MEAALHPWPALGALLMRDGLVTTEQLEAVLSEQRDSPHQRISGKRLGEALVEQGLVTHAQVAQLVAEQYTLPFMELTESEVGIRAAVLVPEALARRVSALPISVLPDSSLLVAVADPPLALFSDELHETLGVPLRFAVATADAVDAAITYAFERARLLALETERDRIPHGEVVEVSETAFPAEPEHEDAAVPELVGLTRPWPVLGALLIRDGLVTEEELDAALAQQRVSGSRRLGEILVQREAVTPNDIARLVAEQHEIPFVDLVGSEVDPEVARRLPEDLARRWSAIPVGDRDGEVVVALADPTRVLNTHELRMAFATPVRFVGALPEAVEAAITHVHATEVSPDADETRIEAVDEEARARAGDATADEEADETAVAHPVEETAVAHPVEETAVAHPVEETAVAHPVEETAVAHQVDDDDTGTAEDVAASYEDGAIEYEAAIVEAEAEEAPEPYEPEETSEDEVEGAMTDDLLQATASVLRWESSESGDAPLREAMLTILEPPSEVDSPDRLNEVLGRALSLCASHVHLTPTAEGATVRARVDGVMRTVETLTPDECASVASGLKELAHLDTAERRTPREGRMAHTIAGRSLDLRLVVVPTKQGEKLTLTVHDPESGRRSLDALGLQETDCELLRAAMQEPFGAVVLCGPVGSGRTTTLYAALRELHTPERTLATVEHPVEHALDGVDQVEVSPSSGLTYARALRAVLRSDPDVVAVGEIQDDEVARLTMRAAGGHLVLATLDAPSSAAAVRRLAHSHEEPGANGIPLTCVVSQRLVRLICGDCRETYYADADELAELGRPAEEAGRRLLARGRSCDACDGTGFHGRVGLFEILALTPDIVALGEARAPVHEIERAAIASGMRTLHDEGVRLCLEGLTTTAEMRRVLGSRRPPF